MFKVKAVYEYNSGHDDDLQFSVGQIITVTEEEDADWYAGEYVDEGGVKHEGIFPRNFVEKYEPTAPPRPTRTRPKNQPEQQPAATDSSAPAAAPLQSPKLRAQEAEAEEHAQAPSGTKAAAALPPEPAAAPEPTSRRSVEIKPPPAASKPAPAPQPAVTSSSPPPAKPTASQSKPAGPPPVSEKPSSFKDRIAAFNKTAATPITPFKPGGLGAGGSFVKKPFVAPPPSRNSYVPPVQNAPAAKLYRRDEDPEIKEREAEAQESAERAGLVPGSHSAEAAAGGGEDEPKPLSLKERLALLQKQQMEAAQRHADAVAKKEKPKRPAKKRMESHDGHHAEPSEASIPASTPAAAVDPGDSEYSAGKQSMDEAHSPRVPHPPRRKSSKGPEPRDGNEADMSGAGETTEGQDDDVTEREDSDQQPKHVATAAKQDDERLNAEEEVNEEDEDEEEEEEDEEVDPEVRRKEELRARMARIAGGMGGMGGMGAIFGGGMPSGAPSAPPKKKKKSAAPEAAEEAATPSTRAPPVPTMMALPGMSQGQPREEVEAEEEEDETELRTPHQESVPHFGKLRDPSRRLSYTVTERNNRSSVPGTTTTCSGRPSSSSPSASGK